VKAGEGVVQAPLEVVDWIARQPAGAVQRVRHLRAIGAM
jgi:hypothetical protein